jgi:hypothetical protein
MADDAELQEYFALVRSVAEFDQRLLTVKSWGVTLSLAALGFGFQYRSYGMFLVAAASSLAFWSLEGVMKRHQMRYYPRMREIEVSRYLRAPEPEREFSAPRIDWSWAQASQIFRGTQTANRLVPQPSTASRAYAYAWLMLHVALPHAITFAIGVLLFLLGWIGWLGFQLGASAAR